MHHTSSSVSGYFKTYDWPVAIFETRYCVFCSANFVMVDMWTMLPKLSKLRPFAYRYESRLESRHSCGVSEIVDIDIDDELLDN